MNKSINPLITDNTAILTVVVLPGSKIFTTGEPIVHNVVPVAAGLKYNIVVSHDDILKFESMEGTDLGPGFVCSLKQLKVCEKLVEVSKKGDTKRIKLHPCFYPEETFYPFSPTKTMIGNLNKLLIRTLSKDRHPLTVESHEGLAVRFMAPNEFSGSTTTNGDKVFHWIGFDADKFAKGELEITDYEIVHHSQLKIPENKYKTGFLLVQTFRQRTINVVSIDPLQNLFMGLINEVFSEHGFKLIGKGRTLELATL